jgi:SAM-dependent methyltransferase
VIGIDAGAFNAWEAAGWEQRAEAYHRYFSSLTGRMNGPLLDLAAVAAGRRVLDVACGPGHLAAAAAARGAVATGIDVAGAMVRLASRLHPGAEYTRADAEDLPFPDGTFDAVVGNLAILHIGRPERAVAEFARVLVPGGVLVLSTWDKPAVGRLPGIFFQAIQEVGVEPPPDLPPGPPFYRFADEAEFGRLLRGAGLRDVSVATVAYSHRFPGVDELWHWMLDGTVRSAVMVTAQPKDTQDRIHEILARLADEYRDGATGELEIPVSLKVAHGHR